MKEAAAAYPDGEALMYEYLEGLLKSPQSVIEGARLNTERENVVLHGKAPDRPPMPRYEGIQALTYMTNRGIKVTPCKKGTDGNYYFSTPYKNEYEKLKFQNPRAKISDCPGFTSDIERIKEYTSDGIALFRFIPADHGFFCLDLDVKDGKHGIAEFDRLLTSWGKPKENRPAPLRDIPKSFPCYTQTPSGGVHLYFKYSGPPPQGSLFSRDYPNIEIKAGALNLTAPGSYKDGKPYVLYGNLDQAPNLYPFIAEKLPRVKQEPKKFIPMNKKEWDRPSWGQIVEWTDKDRRGSGGRNEYAYSLALHAASHDWPENETLAALRGEPYLDGLPERELITAVQSAYTRRRSA
jgi:hypothetical protein